MKEETKRWVFGTRTEKWYLVGPDDRDWVCGITQDEMKQLGEAAAQTKYLSPCFSVEVI